MAENMDKAGRKNHEPLAGPRRPRLSRELSGVVGSFRDHIFFTNATGLVLAANAKALNGFPDDLIGAFFWKALNLQGAGLQQILTRYPLDQVHTIPAPHGKGLWSMRIFPLADIFSPDGFVVLATDNSPLQKLRDTYTERIGENIEALDNSIRLFGAMFDGVQDAMLLLGEDCLVHAVNPRASELLDPDGYGLTGREAKTLFGSLDWKNIAKKILDLKDGARWTARLTCLTTQGGDLPMNATLWRIDLKGFALYHMALRDLTDQMLLEKGLRRKKAEVEGMNLALRNVVQATEKEKRELRQRVLREIWEDLFPALERMASESSLELRRTLKIMIQERLQEMSMGTSMGLSPLLLKLTPREIEVCKLIRLGSRTKDISELLNASVETIQTHRKNIRRKLGLHGREVSLFSFLHQQELLD